MTMNGSGVTEVSRAPGVAPLPIGSQRGLFDVPVGVAYFNTAYNSPQLNAARERLIAAAELALDGVGAAEGRLQCGAQIAHCSRPRVRSATSR